MLGGAEHAVIYEGIRSLFLLILPITIAVALAGVLAGVLQTSTSIVDTSIGYAARLLAVVIVLYTLFPSFSRSIVALAEAAFR